MRHTNPPVIAALRLDLNVGFMLSLCAGLEMMCKLDKVFKAFSYNLRQKHGLLFRRNHLSIKRFTSCRHDIPMPPLSVSE